MRLYSWVREHKVFSPPPRAPDCSPPPPCAHMQGAARTLARIYALTEHEAWWTPQPGKQRRGMAGKVGDVPPCHPAP